MQERIQIYINYHVQGKVHKVSHYPRSHRLPRIERIGIKQEGWGGCFSTRAREKPARASVGSNLWCTVMQVNSIQHSVWVVVFWLKSLFQVALTLLHFLGQLRPRQGRIYQGSPLLYSRRGRSFPLQQNHFPGIEGLIENKQFLGLGGFQCVDYTKQQWYRITRYSRFTYGINDLELLFNVALHCFSAFLRSACIRISSSVSYICL